MLNVGYVYCFDIVLCVPTRTAENWYDIVQIICKYWYISGCTKYSDLSYSAQLATVFYRQ